jgi:hypothetical protein
VSAEVTIAAWERSGFTIIFNGDGEVTNIKVNSIRVREILNQNNYTAVPDFVSEHVSEP